MDEPPPSASARAPIRKCHEIVTTCSCLTPGRVPPGQSLRSTMRILRHRCLTPGLVRLAAHDPRLGWIGHVDHDVCERGRVDLVEVALLPRGVARRVALPCVLHPARVARDRRVRAPPRGRPRERPSGSTGREARGGGETLRRRSRHRRAPRPLRETAESRSCPGSTPAAAAGGSRRSSPRLLPRRSASSAANVVFPAAVTPSIPIRHGEGNAATRAATTSTGVR